MEQVLAMVAWIKNHMVEIAQIVTSIIGVASIIVKMTPGIKDDTIMQKIIAFVGKYIALNVSREDKVPPSK